MAGTKWKIEEIEQMLRTYKGFIGQTAEALGITYTALYKRMSKSARLRAVAEEERQRLLDLAEFKLYEQVNRGNMRAVEFVLKTKGKDRGYVEKQERDFTFGGGGETVVVEHRVRGIAPAESEQESGDDSGEEDQN